MSLDQKVEGILFVYMSRLRSTLRLLRYTLYDNINLYAIFYYEDIEIDDRIRKRGMPDENIN